MKWLLLFIIVSPDTSSFEIREAKIMKDRKQCEQAKESIIIQEDYSKLLGAHLILTCTERKDIER